MPKLKDDIYKIMAITPHDMQVVGSGIIWNRILLPKLDE
jgi:hypothetical protein